MAQESFQEKTEQATPQRKREAKEKGNVPRSNEVNSAVILIISSLVFLILGKSMYHQLFILIKSVLMNLSSIDINIDNLQDMAIKGGTSFALITGPFMLIVMVGGVISNVMQSGITFTASSLQPKIEKISPLAGLKRMFSLRSLVELVKNILKLLIIGYVSYKTVKNEFDGFLYLSGQDASQIAAFIGTMCLKLSIRVGLVFAVIAALDFAYQKYEYLKNLKMTKQEIKEEFKQAEGDPMIKSRIRAIQRERSRSRMLKEVPQADVVITNPTHYAVAIKYDPEKSSAPIVVAKGMRKLAQKIKQIARENNVPVIEKPLVARMLYKSAQVGDEIPMELYQVVAEILAHVYQMKNRTN